MRTKEGCAMNSNYCVTYGYCIKEKIIYSTIFYGMKCNEECFMNVHSTK